MKPLQKKPSSPLQREIDQLLSLFLISLPLCRQRAFQLIALHPRNLTICQITAACESLSGNHQQAIEYYQKCLQMAPDRLAFFNNLAWNHIANKQYLIAITFLNDIRQKWSHPAIYLNLAKALQNSPQFPKSDVEQALRLGDEYKNQYRALNSQTGLIHTFQLEPQQQYTKQIEDFKACIFQFVNALQYMENAPLDFQFLYSTLKQLTPKIEFRKQQQQRYGIVIQKKLKRDMEVLEAFRIKILQNYKPEFDDKDLKNNVMDSIKMLSLNIFRAPLDEKTDLQQYRNQKIIPCILQLQQNAHRMKTIVQNLQKQREQKRKEPEQQLIKAVEDPPVIGQDQNGGSINISNQIKQPHPNKNQKPDEPQRIKQDQIGDDQKIPSQPINPGPVQSKQPEQNKQQDEKQKREFYELLDKTIKNQEKQTENRYERPPFTQPAYHFQVRLDDIEKRLRQDQQFIQQTLKVGKQNIASPLFLILHFKKLDQDLFHVFLNKNRIKMEIFSPPDLPNLQRIKEKATQNLILKYYYVLHVILKLYQIYGTHDFIYERKNVASNIELNHFIQLITPVLNEIFEDEEIFGKGKLGWICNEIHFSLVKFITQTGEIGRYLANINKLLKKIHAILQGKRSTAQGLIHDVLSQKDFQYLDKLLSQEFVKIDGSSKYHEYYHWKINRYHQLSTDPTIRQAFSEEDDWLISNLSLLLITLKDKEIVSSADNLLNQSLVDCFYSSRVRESEREVILRRFYQCNHEVSAVQRMEKALRKILRKVLP